MLRVVPLCGAKGVVRDTAFWDGRFALISQEKRVKLCEDHFWVVTRGRIWSLTSIRSDSPDAGRIPCFRVRDAPL